MENSAKWYGSVYSAHHWEEPEMGRLTVRAGVTPSIHYDQTHMEPVTIDNTDTILARRDEHLGVISGI